MKPEILEPKCEAHPQILNSEECLRCAHIEIGRLTKRIEGMDRSLDNAYAGKRSSDLTHIKAITAATKGIKRLRKKCDVLGAKLKAIRDGSVNETSLAAEGMKKRIHEIASESERRFSSDRRKLRNFEFLHKWVSERATAHGLPESLSAYNVMALVNEVLEKYKAYEAEAK